jgi:signal transduction histidine kinase
MILAVPEPSAAAMTNLQILYQLGAALGSAFDVEQAMQVVMDLVFERVKADRGIILLLKDGQLVPAVVRSREESRQYAAGKVAKGASADLQSGGQPKPPEQSRSEKSAKSDPLKDVFPASSTIIRHVLTTGEGVLSSNAMVDKRFAKGKSVHDLGIRSAMCVPIKARRFQGSIIPSGGGGSEKGQTPPTDIGASGTGVSQGSTQTPVASSVSGLIYIDSSVRNYTYSPDQLRLLSAIGQQAGLAIQNALLYQSAIQGERLAAIGETTAALSHSIKNILQALRGGADVVEMGLRSQNLTQTSKGWGIVSRNLDKIYNLTLNLLAYSKEREPEIALASIKTLIDDCTELILPTAVERQIVLETDIPPDFPSVPMDSDGMHQVMMNLLSNAIDAVEPGHGHIKVRVYLAQDSANGPVTQPHHEDATAVIEVSDNGSGMSPQMLKHAFELFHSTKGNRGTGLGLAVSKKIVAEHHGHISVSSAAGQGTTFKVRLPIAKESLSVPVHTKKTEKNQPHLTDLGDAHIE